MKLGSVLLLSFAASLLGADADAALAIIAVFVCVAVVVAVVAVVDNKHTCL